MCKTVKSPREKVKCYCCKRWFYKLLNLEVYLVFHALLLKFDFFLKLNEKLHSIIWHMFFVLFLSEVVILKLSACRAKLMLNG